MTEETISLYNASNIDSLSWPNNPEGEYAQKFLMPLIKNGVHHYIENVETNLHILKIGDLILPITINDAEYQNSYVCSPYTQYISSGLNYLEKVKISHSIGLVTTFSNF